MKQTMLEKDWEIDTMLVSLLEESSCHNDNVQCNKISPY